MENNSLEQESSMFQMNNIESKNNYYVEELLDKYPKTFRELILKDGSRAAILYNDALISKENKEILPPYDYFVFSSKGLTQFNCSYKGFLSWPITTNAVSALIELSDGQEIENLVVSEWKRWKRVRRNKGLMPLKMVLRSVTVTGIHLEDGIEDFCNNFLKNLVL